MTEAMITIRELADRHGVTHRTLRFYEQKGLLSPYRDGGQRLYIEADSRKLETILYGVSLGFSLSELRDIVVNDGQSWRLEIPKDKAREQAVLMRKREDEAHNAVEALTIIALGGQVEARV